MIDLAISALELSDLIGAIYDCALDPSRWEPALEAVTTRLGFCNSGLAINVLPSGKPLIVVATGMSEYYRRRLFDYDQEILDVLGGPEKLAQLQVGDLHVFSDFADPSIWETNRYAREWSIPQGIVDVAFIKLAHDDRTVSSLSMGRKTMIREPDADALRLFVPHLRRSAIISRVLEARSLVASSFASALDALAGAVVLVDGELRIVHANATGHRILAEGDPLIETAGRLTLRSPIATSALAQAVQEAEKGEFGIGGRGLGIPAPRLDGTPSVLHVLPLRHGKMRPGLAPAATAAIFLAPAGRMALEEGVAAPLFDLTPAEARVFAHMAEGETVAAASRALGINESTVRTHLLRIFEKTGTSRQADLVRLAASLTSVA